MRNYQIFYPAKKSDHLDNIARNDNIARSALGDYKRTTGTFHSRDGTGTVDMTSNTQKWTINSGKIDARNALCFVNYVELPVFTQRRRATIPIHFAARRRLDILTNVSSMCFSKRCCGNVPRLFCTSQWQKRRTVRGGNLGTSIELKRAKLSRDADGIQSHQNATRRTRMSRKMVPLDPDASAYTWTLLTRAHIHRILWYKFRINQRYCNK